MKIDRAQLIAGTSRERRTFTQYHRSTELDASVLTIPLQGFLPGTDERVSGTIDTVWRELGHDAFVSRYSTAETRRRRPVSRRGILAPVVHAQFIRRFRGLEHQRKTEGRSERDGIYGRAR